MRATNAVTVLAARHDAMAGARRRRLRRRAGAWLASITLHAVLLVLGFASLTGAAMSGGAGADAGEPYAVTVSLVGLRGGARASTASQTPQDMLLRRLREQASLLQSDVPKPTPKTADANKLLDLVDHPASNRDRAEDQPGHGQGQLDRGGSGAAADGTPSKAPDRQGAGKSDRTGRGSGRGASNGKQLWGQIAPCWGRLPQVSNVPVSLDVTINAKGQIATPPKVIRPDGAAVNEARLISEGRALAAVAACIPYDVVSIAGQDQVFRVKFAK